MPLQPGCVPEPEVPPAGWRVQASRHDVELPGPVNAATSMSRVCCLAPQVRVRRRPPERAGRGGSRTELDPDHPPAPRWHTVGVVRGVPGWGVVSAAAAPVLLIGGWTVAAGLQPRHFNAVASTISSLAAEGAADRWVMTLALAGTGACYVVTGLALRPAALPGRLILMAGGVATVLVAANPEPAGGGGSLPHTFWAAVAFTALAAWPLAAWRREQAAPAGLRAAVSAWAGGVLIGLLGWFGAELAAGGRQVGLAERILAGGQAVWPLALVLACLLSQSRAGRRRAAAGEAGLRAPGSC